LQVGPAESGSTSALNLEHAIVGVRFRIVSSIADDGGHSALIRRAAAVLTLVGPSCLRRDAR